MFAIVGQVERPIAGREAFQEIDQVATLGGLAKWAAEPRTADEVRDAMAEAIRQALGGRPGPVLLSLPEDLLDEPVPDDARLDAVRPARRAPTDEEVRAVIELLASARRPVILAGAGVLRARTSTELTRFAELLQVPVIAGVASRRTSSRTTIRCTSAWPASGRPRSVRERLDAADALLVIGSRLNEPTTYGYTMPRDRACAGRTSTSSRAARRVRRPRRSRSRPTPRRSSRPPTSGCSAGPCSTRRSSPPARRTTRGSSRLGGRVGRRRAARGTAPASIRAASIATLRRVLPDDAILTTRCRQLRELGGPRLPVPPARHVPRPDLGRDGLRPAGGDRRRAGPSRSSGRRARRRRRAGDDHGRARDGGRGSGPGSSSSCFDNERYGTIRMWQERRGTGVGVATELGPVDFAAIARACGARGVRVERDADFEPALRAALAADRATVIQLALDKAWLSVDQPPGLMRPTFTSSRRRSGRLPTPAGRRTPPRRSRPRGSSTAPTASTRSASRSTATTRPTRGRSWR